MFRHTIPLLIAAAALMPAAAAAQTYARGTIGMTIDGPSNHRYEGHCFRPNPRTGACNTFTRQIEERDQGIAADVAIGRQIGRFIRAEGVITYMRNESNKSGCIDCTPPVAGNGFAYTPTKRIGATDRVSMTGRLLAVAPLGKASIYGGGGFGGIATLSHNSLPDKGGWRIARGKMNTVTELVAGLEYAVSPRTSVVLQGVQQSYRTRYDFMSDLYTLVATSREKTTMRAVTAGVRIKLGK